MRKRTDNMTSVSHTNIHQSASTYAKRGLLVRLIYLAISSAWWMLSGFGKLIRTRCITLCYHGVTDQYKEPFRRQMELAADRTIDAANLGGIAKTGRGKSRVCVTFDDAFENLLTNALPITRGLGIPTIIFAVTRNLGSRPQWEIAPDHPDASEPTMTEHQIRGAAGAEPVTFGSHGATHRCLTGLLPGEIAEELATSKTGLERITGSEVDDFAFPYGENDPSLINAAFAAGYRRVFTLDPADTRTDGAKLIIGRMSMSPAVWKIEFCLTIAGAYEWLPYIRKGAGRARLALCSFSKTGGGQRSGLKARLTGL